jgi:hypothetical protein
VAGTDQALRTVDVLSLNVNAIEDSCAFLKVQLSALRTSLRAALDPEGRMQEIVEQLHLREQYEQAVNAIRFFLRRSYRTVSVRARDLCAFFLRT